ncbi:MAG TPA: M56 family metallopeptidase, partial [Gemmataceae bacterium]|nr:M56 family metallopeptidase [Gemmataceae bacterium]
IASSESVVVPDGQLVEAELALPARPVDEFRVVVQEPAAEAEEPPPAPWWAAWDPAPLLAWLPVVGCVWLAGSAVCFAAAGVRVVRFQRLLRHAKPAPPDLQALAEALARRLGLARCPAVLLVPGPVAPMVWALPGCARLLFPSALLGQLNAEGRSTLLLHELAHLRRRDHWVRWLELIVAGLFWWYPLLGWVRRRLRAAEEECCDAWVVAEMPEAAPTYAATLLDTLDFLAGAKPALPPVASGIARVHLLRRRLAMIVTLKPPRRLSLAGRLAVAALALALLPWAPGLAQQKRTAEGDKAADAAPAPDKKPAAADDEPLTFDPRPQQLPPDPGPVWAVAFSPDGNTLAVVTGGTLNQQPQRLRLAVQALNQIQQAPPAGNSGWLKLWDVKTGREIASHKEGLPIRAVAWSPDGRWLATAEFDNTTKLRDPKTGAVKRVLRGHTAGVNGVAFSPDGKLLATASLDKTARLWDVDTGKELASLNWHKDRVLSVAFSPDGKLLVTGSGDKTAKIWEVRSRKELRTLQGHNNMVQNVAFSPDSKTVATASYDGTVKLWEAAAGKEKLTLQGHNGPVLGVTFSPDGRTVATTGGDQTVRLWDAESGADLGTMRGHTNQVWSVRFAPDGKTLATGSFDRTARLWDVAGKKQRDVIQGKEQVAENAAVLALAYHPDGKSIAVAREDTFVHLLDLATGKPRLTFKGHGDVVAGLAFRPDGKVLATASYDRTVKLWDAATGKELRTLKGHTNWVFAVAFSRDGKLIATGSYDKTIRLWDAATGKEVATLRGHTAAVRSLAFSPDGKTLASGSGDRTVRLWDVEKKEERLKLKGHTGTVRGVAFSPDGKVIASASEDHTVKLWQADTGQEQATLKAHADMVYAVAFSPRGRTLLSAGLDATVRVWDPANAVVRASQRAHADAVTAVAFAPDGMQFATGSLDRTVRLWAAQAGPAREQREQKIRDREARVKAVRAFVVDREKRTPVALRPEPLLRWSAGDRPYQEDAIYAVGRSGRPLALMALAYQPQPQGKSVWLYKLVSLAPAPLAVEGSEGWKWGPQKPGLDWKPLPGAPAPSEKEAERREQTDEQARRFFAGVVLNPDAPPMELRLLPRPLCRYADPAAGIVSGAVYAFADGSTPGVLLLVEARRQGSAAPAWHFAVARMSRRELITKLDDAEVWRAPGAGNPMPTDAFWITNALATPPAPPKALLPGHKGQVWFSVWSPDGQRLVTGGDDEQGPDGESVGREQTVRP